MFGDMQLEFIAFAVSSSRKPGWIRLNTGSLPHRGTHCQYGDLGQPGPQWLIFTRRVSS